VWRNLLKADPSVDLVHFTILRPPEKQDGTPIRELSLIAFPVRELFELKINEFDLIIFDRYKRRGILPNSYYQNIADYVKNGGALLEASGPAFAAPALSLSRTPLMDVLPARPTGQVRVEPFRPALSDVGRRHPVTAGLPGAGQAGEQPQWGRWFQMVDTDPQRGNALLAGIAGKPVLMLDRVGKGRVAQMTSDQAWLWARGFQGGGPQAELLRRMAHWLMKEPDRHQASDLKRLLGFRHRTFNDTDLLYFVAFLDHHYTGRIRPEGTTPACGTPSLETAFSSWMRRGDTDTTRALAGFHRYFLSLPDAPGRTRKHVPTPERGSSCKRLNMFLRWMVRHDRKGVDFGLWRSIRPDQLVCPIDVHVARTARRFGLLQRPQTDWQAALELTGQLRRMNPKDPVRYDFALFGLGAEEGY